MRILLISPRIKIFLKIYIYLGTLCSKDCHSSHPLFHLRLSGRTGGKCDKSSDFIWDEHCFIFCRHFFPGDYVS